MLHNFQIRSLFLAVSFLCVFSLITGCGHSQKQNQATILKVFKEMETIQKMPQPEETDTPDSTRTKIQAIIDAVKAVNVSKCPTPIRGLLEKYMEKNVELLQESLDMLAKAEANPLQAQQIVNESMEKMAAIEREMNEYNVKIVEEAKKYKIQGEVEKMHLQQEQ